MSAGHRGVVDRERGEPADLKSALDNPKLVAALKRLYHVDQRHDIPYLAGYSQGGKTIYLDRHLPKRIKLGERYIDCNEFLELHEHVEKTLIDILGWAYPAAHEAATECEHGRVKARGIDPKVYEAALKPYIKADAIEKLGKVPDDLDLTPYRSAPVNQALLKHLATFQSTGAKLSKREVHYGGGKPAAHYQPKSKVGWWGTCELVGGVIDPQKWCDRFAKK